MKSGGTLKAVLSCFCRRQLFNSLLPPVLVFELLPENIFIVRLAEGAFALLDTSTLASILENLGL